MSKVYLLLPLTLLLSVSSLADFSSAVTAYQNKQFETAFIEFKRLAELGDAPSQRNLATMYARGEHVGKDLAEAWAWSSLASEQDLEASTPILAQIAAKLTAVDKLAGEQRWRELQQQFGQTAIAERLLPVPTEKLSNCTVDVSADVKPRESFPPRYPKLAWLDRIEGYACLAFYLSETGKPLRVMAYEASIYKDDNGKPKRSENVSRYTNAFSRVAEVELERWTFTPPATQALREIPRHACVQFIIRDSVKDRELDIEDAELHKSALSGDPIAQHQFARALENSLNSPDFPEEKYRQFSTAMQTLYKRSALAGYADSQFKMAKDLLTGNRCEMDVGKGIAWLTFAAQQGHADAQYLLASRLRHGDSVESNSEKAIEWLQAAADSGHSRARLEYALYLLQQRPDQLELARRYLPETPKSYDLVELEATALSDALTGNFSKAVEHQEEVVAIAKDIKAAHKEREMVLARYRTGQLPLFVTMN